MFMIYDVCNKRVLLEEFVNLSLCLNSSDILSSVESPFLIFVISSHSQTHLLPITAA